MSENLVAAKKALRAEIRERRRNITEHERAEATAAITEHLKHLVAARGVKKLSCYLATPSEPETRPFLSWAYDNGIEVLLPVSRDDGLLDWAIANDSPDENIGMYGLPEPTGELVGPIAINGVDLIIVPASAVDKQGVRMGWGRGYFDKTLGSMGKRPPVYAIVFDSEYVDSLPREVHDQPVTGVVTPSALITF
ncbi:5-formyltetrahydrofolate cyclo-ligase [Aurantimicrobium minutum]|uniref:5-formyltetrahydrofolate cyclo-ligase n=1 Tax=Aurantimicrobium minutum TaxID=708131 RepID=UPI002475886E|nr:5-formyltetrahydrofolate cyclo-ligase [Aurantimicrobium minutum]MDH6423119.1 5-formyltetrahydrofolate cyclo-ligase [Aurantimicrobium minutum]